MAQTIVPQDPTPQVPVTLLAAGNNSSGVSISPLDVEGVILNGVDGGQTSVFNADVQAMQAATGQTGSAQLSTLDGFFSTFNNTTNPVPTDLTTFVDDFVTYLQQNNIQLSESPSKLENSLLSSFLEAYESNITGQTDPSWTSLPDVDFTIDTSNPENSPLFSQLNAAWSTFANNYPYTTGGVIGSSVPTTSAPITTNFFQQWRDFTGLAAVVNSADTTPQFDSSSGTDPGTPNTATLLSYEQIFNVYFPSLATTGSNSIDPNTGVSFFQENLQAFYNSQVNQKGYFNPSQDFATYLESIQSQAGVLTQPSVRLPTTSTDILDNILVLIINMIGTIENAAAAQSNRLSLYTSWQQAYTSILGQVHVFTEQSNDYLATGFNLPQSTLARIRQDVQGTTNTQLTQKITSYQDTITNDAKSLQSNVNQSTDDFNQQANAATAILQELSTILSSIFQS